MRTLILLVATGLALLTVAAPAAAEPWGPLAEEVTVDATGGACLGGSMNTASLKVGPLTVTVITCDPYGGNGPT